MTPSQQRSIRIRAAFNAAAAAYRPPEMDLDLLLIRPAGEPRIRIGLHQFADMADGTGQRVVDPDNGWGVYFSAVHIATVPGNHNTMLDDPSAVAAALLRILPAAVTV